MKTDDEMIGKTDADLCAISVGHLEMETKQERAKLELRRRERVEQHKLDVDLVAGQVRWMKFSVVAIIVASILSAVLGAMLSWLVQRGR